MNNGPRIITLEPGESMEAPAGALIRLRSHQVKSVLLEVHCEHPEQITVGVHNHGMRQRARMRRMRK